MKKVVGVCAIAACGVGVLAGCSGTSADSLTDAYLTAVQEGDPSAIEGKVCVEKMIESAYPFASSQYSWDDGMLDSAYEEWKAAGQPTASEIGPLVQTRSSSIEERQEHDVVTQQRIYLLEEEFVVAGGSISTTVVDGSACILSASLYSRD